MNYLDLPIREIHAALVEKKVTPLELTQEALRRAKESKDNAFETLLEDEAIAFAKTLTEPEVDNLLWGIPYCAKDNFSTKGIETTASSNVLSGYVPLFDATVVTKLKEKKCVLIGKTTLDELAMGGTGTTGHKGITFNPYDPSHTHLVGGSSCGSAAVTAAGIVPFALGSDTGDSVRKPASYAGLVGMKPTWGRISRFGLFPFAPSLDHAGFFTRSVEDNAIVLEALSGRDLHDATSSERPVDDYVSNLNAGIKGKRIAVISEIFDSVKDETVRRSFEKSLQALKEAGAVVDFVEFGRAELEAIYASYMVISCAEATSNDANLDGIKFGPFRGGKTYQEVMSNARTQGFSELIKRRFVIGSFALMRENQDVLFLRAQKARAKIVRRTNEILKDYDAILALAAPKEAPLINGMSDKLSDEYLIADNHLAIGNFAGLPSITLPLTFVRDLPVGINFTGRAFEEKELLQISEAFESISGLGGLSILNKKEARL